MYEANRWPAWPPRTHRTGGGQSTLSAFLAYCFEQGITERKLTPEELFAPELGCEMPV
ncbi:MAG TPA: hypothetical protein VJX48_01950 [Xanthobacteraceae bacterium]|nr:hypothetical protein [Xanthobacteraceae bacterium]